MKRFATLLLILTLLLMCVTACSPKEPLPQEQSLPSQEEMTPPQQSQNFQQGDGGTTEPSPPQEEEATLIVAQRSEREFAFHITVPGLMDFEGTNNNGQTSIYFDNGMGTDCFIAIDPYESFGNRLHAGPSLDIIGNVEYEQGTVWGLVHIPESTSFDWSALDMFTLSVPHESGYWMEYEFSKNDIERPMEEVSEDVALLSDMTEFYVDRDAISLKAKDNGDGSLTFTYRDTAMEQAYLYPWSWLEREAVSSMYLTCYVDGMSPGSRDSVIQSGFGFRRQVGAAAYISTNIWDNMTVNMVEALEGKGLLPNDQAIWFGRPLDSEEAGQFFAPDDFSVTFDENGLTATWTQAFNPGYSMDDVAAFQVTLQYDVYVLGNGENGIPFLQTRFTPEQDALGQYFDFEVADVME